MLHHQPDLLPIDYDILTLLSSRITPLSSNVLTSLITLHLSYNKNISTGTLTPNTKIVSVCSQYYKFCSD